MSLCRKNELPVCTMESQSLISFAKVVSAGKKTLVQYLMTNGLLRDSCKCPKFEPQMKLCEHKCKADEVIWRCRKGGCDESTTVKIGTTLKLHVNSKRRGKKNKCLKKFL